MKSTFTSIALCTANIPAFIVYPFDTLYHSFLIYSKPFCRLIYILILTCEQQVEIFFTCCIYAMSRSIQLRALNPILNTIRMGFQAVPQDTYSASFLLPSGVQHPHSIIRMTKPEISCTESFLMIIPSLISVIRAHRKEENMNVSQSDTHSPF